MGVCSCSAAVNLLLALQESSRLIEGASFQRRTCLDQAVDLCLAVGLPELKVHGHVVAAGGNAPEEGHGVVQHLLLVCARALGIDNGMLGVTNLTFELRLLRLEAGNQGFGFRLEGLVLALR